jgi:Thiamine pyrophosphate-requiring enzymes [acetolactate synthase, pyruvate dehydrogenase (cytochrome), glyoxylate carboligase, phosphonopyruvate decarboxylase]
VKHNYLVRDVNDLGAIVHEAFYLARSGRPGPVVIDIPKDVSAAQTRYCRLEKIRFPLTNNQLCATKSAVRRAATAILKARRPVLYVGGGIVNAGAAGALREFAEGLQLPVTPTLMGLGGFPSAHPLMLGMLGMHGTYAATRRWPRAIC